MLCLLLRDGAGDCINSKISVEGSELVLHARGGAKDSNPLNPEYSEALLVLLTRLQKASIGLSGVWLDSRATQDLDQASRSLLRVPEEASLPPMEIRTLLGSRMRLLGQAQSGGNSTKRIRLATTAADPQTLLKALRAVVIDTGDKDRPRLPAPTLELVDASHVLEAIHWVKEHQGYGKFGESTDFDLIDDEGTRLPPKTVFGKALSLALGGVQVEPKHFTAGVDSKCFALLREAGCKVIAKGESAGVAEIAADPEMEWAEGKPKLVTHLEKERGGRVVVKAKKADFKRQHGRLFCERCNLDPVEHYGTELAESVIEVHHAAVAVSEMQEDHKTKLSDLQCLCANCHRLVHRLR